MRYVLLALLLVGCQPQVLRVTFHPGVEVPSTPEALACKRQCMALLSTSCSADRTVVAVDNTVTETIWAIGRYSEALGCPGLYSDCMFTCPGATFLPPGPRVEREDRTPSRSEGGSFYEAGDY